MTDDRAGDVGTGDLLQFLRRESDVDALCHPPSVGASRALKGQARTDGVLQMVQFGASDDDGRNPGLGESPSDRGLREDFAVNHIP